MAGTAEQNYLDALIDEFSFHYSAENICAFLQLPDMNFSITMLRVVMKRLNEVSRIAKELKGPSDG